MTANHQRSKTPGIDPCPYNDQTTRSQHALNCPHHRSGEPIRYFRAAHAANKASEQGIQTPPPPLIHNYPPQPALLPRLNSAPSSPPWGASQPSFPQMQQILSVLRIKNHG
ncbi:hypothetical protein P154DRAFT_534596 [Amniculicola lignicola CBS 123094]|uniref:Uncharacterized protein n=1 Tax=Amniculicola lignicola CBS 123094 TaxID=1392246 RepID=A0A6A5WF63_9PLEO|nr:hypothetical protein P154DRAFT_534596 [Amniculicola lignicola CBS 123094]